MDIFLSPDAWIALLTLTFLEIVLGIDNIIFISIVTGRLPEEKQNKTRLIGLGGALVFRVLLLLTITWIIGFTKPLFSVFSFEVSGRDIILALGGMFLLAKSTSEIHHKMAGEPGAENPKPTAKVGGAIVQIILLDMIFSFDSILTAVGLTDHVLIMIIAVIIALIIMTIFAGAVSRLIHRYPTLQILALSFLIMIGFMLVVDALHYHVPKGYLYFSVFFSLLVEIINIRIQNRAKKKLENKQKANSQISG